MEASAAILTAMIETVEVLGIVTENEAETLCSALTNPQNRQYGDMSDTAAAVDALKKIRQMMDRKRRGLDPFPRRCFCQVHDHCLNRTE